MIPPGGDGNTWWPCFTSHQSWSVCSLNFCSPIPSRSYPWRCPRCRLRSLERFLRRSKSYVDFQKFYGICCITRRAAGSCVGRRTSQGDSYTSSHPRRLVQSSLRGLMCRPTEVSPSLMFFPALGLDAGEPEHEQSISSIHLLRCSCGEDAGLCGVCGLLVYVGPH